MDQQDEIRGRISAKLEERELTVRGVSLAAGLGETTLRNFLKGMTASFTVTTAEKIAPVLGVTTTWLLNGEDKAKQDAEVVSIFSRIPTDRREQALRTLRSFTAGN